MHLKERQKDLRANDYLDDFSDELKRTLDFENTLMHVMIRVANYDNPRNQKYIRLEDDISDADWVPYKISINVYHYMKTVEGFDAYKNFPYVVVDLVEKAEFRYNWTEKKVEFSLGLGLPYIKSKLEEYKEYFPYYTTQQLFCYMIERFLFNGDTMRDMVVHEISHLFDDLIEFPYTSDFVGDQKNMNNDEYLQHPVELEANFRKVLYPYYRKNQKRFQYIAQASLDNKNINHLIRDIIDDLTQQYQELDIWEKLDQEHRERILKRMFSSITDLVDREANKLEN
jgi:hypothetical protein